jgi:hypothetical protein
VRTREDKGRRLRLMWMEGRIFANQEVQFRSILRKADKVIMEIVRKVYVLADVSNRTDPKMATAK